ncbi:MAG: ArsA family ATPase [Deltaproteobacteria bacterium]|nr:ArsA family ATPase [Deltaproteobacteria bacterium]
MNLAELIEEKRIIVCCGAGGVGKTTTSAALALAAARRGRRALVLTIDPAKRLAQAMGLPPTGQDPVQIDRTKLARASVELPQSGELWAWMLDAQVVLDRVVERFAPSEEAKARIRETRLFHALREVIAGLQEYTAAEALFDFESQGRFDLIVLDTPPSRNALDFLDAPRRLTRFLDERTLAIFAPDVQEKASALVRAAARIVSTAIAKAFSESFAIELQQFLGAFGTLFGKMRIHADGVRELLSSNRSAFLVVTSTEPTAVDEALFFKRRVAELGLTTEGFVLNRSYAIGAGLVHPREALDRATDPVARSALSKLAPMADLELRRAAVDRGILEKLVAEGVRDRGKGAVALPYLDQSVEDLAALALLSRYILTAV